MSNVPSVIKAMQHYVDFRLEPFSNGTAYPPSSPANKTNGYVAAKIPDWQLRRWIEQLSGEVA